MTSLPNDESDGGIPAYDSDRFDLTQDEFDREFFTQVLRHGDSNLDVVRRLAELLARHGDYGGSLRLDQQLCERCPDEPLVFYNLACSLSMHGDHREAIDALAARSSWDTGISLTSTPIPIWIRCGILPAFRSYCGVRPGARITRRGSERPGGNRGGRGRGRRRGRGIEIHEQPCSTPGFDHATWWPLAGLILASHTKPATFFP